jgi:hypothetical protein
LKAVSTTGGHAFQLYPPPWAWACHIAGVFAKGSQQTLLPSLSVAHRFEQHSPSAVQDVPTGRQATQSAASSGQPGEVPVQVSIASQLC